MKCGGEAEETVETVVVYLGSEVRRDGGVKGEVRRRLALASRVFNALRKPL